jgi:hypothetical protein
MKNRGMKNRAREPVRSRATDVIGCAGGLDRRRLVETTQKKTTARDVRAAVSLLIAL